MRLVGLILLLALSPCCVRAEPGAELPEPYHLVRALQSLQNQIVSGSRPSLDAQPQLVNQIGIEFARSLPEIWRDRRNGEAAASFLLSGGPAGPVRRLLTANVIPQAQARLVKGALAFAEGRRSDARKLLEPIDPLSLGDGIGGQLALTQSMLVLEGDPGRSLELLDIARLLSPGTIVEEAALRRQIFIVGEQGNLRRFARLGAIYQRRFPNSLYAKSITSRFREAILKFASEGTSPFIDEIEALLASIPPEEQCDMFLGIARVALIKANFPLAGRAAERARQLSKAQSAESLRADAYRAIAGIGNGDAKAALAALEALDGKRLPTDDRELLEVALALARQKASFLPAAKSQEKAPAASDTKLTQTSVPPGQQTLLDDGQKALGNARRLLDGAMP